ncbi:hypothetical protein ACJX0J_019233, partial [Zea mays]
TLFLKIIHFRFKYIIKIETVMTKVFEQTHTSYIKEGHIEWLWLGGDELMSLENPRDEMKFLLRNKRNVEKKAKTGSGLEQIIRGNEFVLFDFQYYMKRKRIGDLHAHMYLYIYNNIYISLHEYAS